VLSYATQVLLAQPKAHRSKCAEKQHVVEIDSLELKEFFKGYQDADVCSGKCKRVVEGKKKATEGLLQQSKQLLMVI
jgi:hypothetical protein